MRRSPAVFAAAVALGALVLAGCGDAGKDRIPAAASLSLGTVPPTTVTTVPSSSAAVGPVGPVPTAAGGSPSTGVHSVGDVVFTATGNTVTLHGIEADVATPASAPPPGSTVLAVDVETCAKAGATQVGPQLFRLELDDRSSQEAVDAGRLPALLPAPVAKGNCARGWVSFDVPGGRAPSLLVFTGSSVIRWPLT